MKHIAAYLLLVLGGNESPSAEDVQKALSSVGVEVDDSVLSKLIADLDGKSLSELLEEGSGLLAKFGGGGGGGGGGGNEEDAPVAEEKVEEKPEEEEVDMGGGIDMFGGDEGDGEGY